MVSRDVFISHSARDRDVAEAACDALERAGHLCWIAPRDILPGEDQGEAAVDGIRASKVFLLILSARSVDSSRILHEAERAADAGLAIVPFRIEAVELSASLAHLGASAHWLDAITPPPQPHFAYLTAIVGRLLDGGEGAPLRPLTAPPRPLPPLGRATPSWLPIAVAGLIGLIAIAIVATIMGTR